MVRKVNTKSIVMKQTYNIFRHQKEAWFKTGRIQVTGLLRNA